MHCPYKSHLNLAMHVMRYLKGCPGKGILISKILDLYVSAFVDAGEMFEL